MDCKTVFQRTRARKITEYLLLIVIFTSLVIPQLVSGGTTGTSVITGNVMAPLVRFTANSTEGGAPLAVQFTDMSTIPGATGWSWDFGDGTGSILQNPAHTYAGGVYTVILTVTDGNGTFANSSENYVTVFASKNNQTLDTGPALTGTSIATFNQSAFTVVGGTSSVSGNTLTLVYPPGSSINRMTITLDAVNNSNGNISGTVNSILLETKPVTVTLPSTGESGTYTLNLQLNSVPSSGADIQTTIIDGADAANANTFQAFAASNGMAVLSTRYELVVSDTIPASSIAGALITMEVPASWYNAYGSNLVRIMRKDNAGSVSILDTVFSGFDGTNAIYIGNSPGLSTFGITALQGQAVVPVSPPASQPASPATQSNGGDAAPGGSGGGTGISGSSASPANLGAPPGQLAPAAPSAVTPVNGIGPLTGTPLTADLAGMPGVTVSWTTEINKNPAPDARLTTVIQQNPDPSVLNAFTFALNRAGLDIGSLAYVMIVQKTGIPSTGPATVSMTVPGNWVTRNGGTNAISIVRMADDGATEVLATTFAGYDPGTGYMTFTATSEHGFSTWGLVAVKPHTVSSVPANGQMAPARAPAGTTSSPTSASLLIAGVAGIAALLVITGVTLRSFIRRKK